jgi:tRNA(Arg) A34 adenosine deaminase TadA
MIAQDVAPISGSRIAAKITINNKEVGFGVNSYKTDPLQKKYGKNDDAICIHAEILAIKNSFRRIERDEFKNATLYIARAKRDSDNKNYVFGMARPCKGCMRAIAAFEFSRVVYTCENGEIDIF